jgi:hypothetical protein
VCLVDRCTHEGLADAATAAGFVDDHVVDVGPPPGRQRIDHEGEDPDDPNVDPGEQQRRRLVGE